MTVNDLINASLRKLGVLASGEVPSANESNDALVALNNMLDSWSTERLVIYAAQTETFALVPGQRSYTWGPGGNFNSSRPQLINRGLIQVVGTNPVLELEMDNLNETQYAEIQVKAITSSIPTAFYNDDSNPLTNVMFWPVPNVNANVIFYAWKPFSDFASLQTAIVLPPGYLRALTFNLAIELAPDYGKKPDDAVVALAIQALKNIKRMNSNPIYLKQDAALQDPKHGSFNWLTGDEG